MERILFLIGAPICISFLLTVISLGAILFLEKSTISQWCYDKTLLWSLCPQAEQLPGILEAKSKSWGSTAISEVIYNRYFCRLMRALYCLIWIFMLKCLYNLLTKRNFFCSIVSCKFSMLIFALSNNLYKQQEWVEFILSSCSWTL